jgi:hypothetical protein
VLTTSNTSSGLLLFSFPACAHDKHNEKVNISTHLFIAEGWCVLPPKASFKAFFFPDQSQPD